jgi:hypothetical protein
MTDQKQTPLHSEKILQNTIKKMPQPQQHLRCDSCGFTSIKQSNWLAHISTKKHQRNTNTELMNDKLRCECGKKYKHTSSLYNHRKICNSTLADQTIPTGMFMEFMKKNQEIQSSIVEQNKELQITILHQNQEVQSTILEQNKELQNKLLELSQKPQTITTTNIQNNVQNNFNLNMFLNEQCKDAISITDFIDSLQLEVSDLEATGKLGYVLGISRIFINKLKELDIHERPLHCTDIKRETVYIKDKDVWEKESKEKSTLKQVVKKIARKNLQQLPAWQQQNPDFKTLDTPENNEFMKISLSALGAYSTEEEEKDINKIMKNVLKEVVVDKK